MLFFKQFVNYMHFLKLHRQKIYMGDRMQILLYMYSWKFYCTCIRGKKINLLKLRLETTNSIQNLTHIKITSKTIKYWLSKYKIRQYSKKHFFYFYG